MLHGREAKSAEREVAQSVAGVVGVLEPPPAPSVTVAPETTVVFTLDQPASAVGGATLSVASDVSKSLAT